jgi:hypothetical protein
MKNRQIDRKGSIRAKDRFFALVEAKTLSTTAKIFTNAALKGGQNCSSAISCSSSSTTFRYTVDCSNSTAGPTEGRIECLPINSQGNYVGRGLALLRAEPEFGREAVAISLRIPFRSRLTGLR